MLEHTHQFTEFERVYEPINSYNDFQYNWITKRMTGSIEEYISFINRVKNIRYPVKVKFGLEVCYIPETADILAYILAHPDSIKCFGYKPNIYLTEYYNKLSMLLNKHGIYAENSGGLKLNYSSDIELGLNPQLLSI